MQSDEHARVAVRHDLTNMAAGLPRGVPVLPPRVLHIEDSPTIQLLVAASLRGSGVEVEARGDGESGLDAALRDPPDVVVLDIGLPGMSGWEVLDRLRADERTRHLPVLVLTAHAQNEARAVEHGADRFMPKPFLPHRLCDAVLELARTSP